MKLTTHLHLVLNLRMTGAIPLLSVCLHGVDRDKFTFFVSVYSSKNLLLTYKFFFSVRFVVNKLEDCHSLRISYC